MKNTLLTMIVLFSLSCSFFTGLIPNSGKSLSSTGKGPENLKADAASADSVKLTWQPVTGATSYHIAVSISGGDPISLLDLGPSATSYEDFLAMPGSQLKYAVEASSDSGSIGQSVVDVTTPQRKPNPLTVDAQLDTKKTASATIGPDGGSISLTDKKGVVYKLDIPAGALDLATEITLTAVKNIGSWPLDGDMLAAVKIEPDGLTLKDVATLSITLPSNQSPNKLSNLGFAFSGTGQEFHLQPAYNQKSGTGFVPGVPGGGHLLSPAKQSPAEIVQETLVMYGIGVGQGSAESAGNLAKNNAPSDAGAAMDQKLVATQAEVDDLAPLPKVGDVAASISATAIQSLIYAADDCGSIRSAIVALQKWRRSSEYNGSQFPDQIHNSDKGIVNSLADKLKDIIDKASEECKNPSGKGPVAAVQAGCLESILDSIANPPHTGTGVWNDLQVAMVNKFDSHFVADADNAFAKCLPSYQASGGSNGYGFSGTICDLRKSFTLTASGMEQFSVVFTPTSGGLGGSVVAAGGGGGCSDGGGGAYIVNISANGSGNIIAKFPASTITCPGVSKTNEVVQVVTITPLAEKPSSCSQ